jgi:hypothetical protein
MRKRRADAPTVTPDIWPLNLTYGSSENQEGVEFASRREALQEQFDTSYDGYHKLCTEVVTMHVKEAVQTGHLPEIFTLYSGVHSNVVELIVTDQAKRAADKFFQQDAESGTTKFHGLLLDFLAIQAHTTQEIKDNLK